MQELISIIMPYKNCALFLVETINSILTQTYTNWELIAVNDHSTDDSYNSIQQFAQQDQRIYNLTNNGVGIIEALQTGFAFSKGTYITRMDADDISLPHKLSQLKTVIDKHGKDTVAIGKVHYFKSNGETIGNGYLSYQEWINNLADLQNSFSEIYKECTIPSPSWMLLRDTFNLIGGFNNNTYPEDYDLAFRMYNANLKPIGTLSIVHHWRDYATRTSRTDSNYKDNRFLALKTHYFIQIDYNPNQLLTVLGAGKKGKTIAQLLIAQGIAFEWFCGTANKIGHTIYGKVLQNSNLLPQNAQIIVAIAAKEALHQIKEKEDASNDYFYFC